MGVKPTNLGLKWILGLMTKLSKQIEKVQFAKSRRRARRLMDHGPRSFKALASVAVDWFSLSHAKLKDVVPLHDER